MTAARSVSIRAKEHLEQKKLGTEFTVLELSKNARLKQKPTSAFVSHLVAKGFLKSKPVDGQRANIYEIVKPIGDYVANEKPGGGPAPRTKSGAPKKRKDLSLGAAFQVFSRAYEKHEKRSTKVDLSQVPTAKLLAELKNRAGE
jgi:hypothetical protein